MWFSGSQGSDLYSSSLSLFDPRGKGMSLEPVTLEAERNCYRCYENCYISHKKKIASLHSENLGLAKKEKSSDPRRHIFRISSELGAW